MSKNWIYSRLWKSSKTRRQYWHLESFTMKADILTNGSMVKNHISSKNGIRILCNTENFVFILILELSTSSAPQILSSTSMTFSRLERNHLTFSSSSSTLPITIVWSDSELRAREDLSGIDSHRVPVSNSRWTNRTERPVHQANQKSKTKKTKKKLIERRDPLFPKPTQNLWPSQKETTRERGDPLCSDIPECLLELKENLVDDGVLEWSDPHASSSHEFFSEPPLTTTEDVGKHSVYTHFPRNRNCEIYQRTKITRAPCRRRNGGTGPRAVYFGDLITADHKVLSDNCESRNSRWYAIVVQDVTTQ